MKAIFASSDVPYSLVIWQVAQVFTVTPYDRLKYHTQYSRSRNFASAYRLRHSSSATASRKPRTEVPQESQVADESEDEECDKG